MTKKKKKKKIVTDLLIKKMDEQVFGKNKMNYFVTKKILRFVFPAAIDSFFHSSRFVDNTS